MSLHNYLARSTVPFEEIRSGFDHEQVQQLYNLLKELGCGQYLCLVQEHQTDILKYISLTSSQRNQKRWVNHPDILLIRFAAYQISLATVKLLDDIEPIVHIVDGGSYRAFHSTIADALFESVLYSPLLAFFDGYDNPFLE